MASEYLCPRLQAFTNGASPSARASWSAACVEREQLSSCGAQPDAPDPWLARRCSRRPTDLGGQVRFDVGLAAHEIEPVRHLRGWRLLEPAPKLVAVGLEGALAAQVVAGDADRKDQVGSPRKP